jgi:hypothetical protein
MRYYSRHAVFGVRQVFKKKSRIHRGWRLAKIPAPIPSPSPLREGLFISAGYLISFDCFHTGQRQERH